MQESKLHERSEMEELVELRRWDELIPDALGLIFRDLSLQEKLTVVPRVCKAWEKAVAGPYCWREIDIKELSKSCKAEKLDRMLQMLVVRSCGNFYRLSVSGLANEAVLWLSSRNDVSYPLEGTERAVPNNSTRPPVRTQFKSAADNQRPEKMDYKRETRFSLKCSAKEIISKIEETAKPLGFYIHKKNFKMILENLIVGRKGNLNVATQIFEVAPSLHMVEIKKARGDTLEFLKRDAAMLHLYSDYSRWSRSALTRARVSTQLANLAQASTSEFQGQLRRSFNNPELDLETRFEFLEAFENAFDDSSNVVDFNFQRQRDFNEGDYEMLLALDDRNHEHAGATESQINRLPDSVIQMDGTSEACVICLDPPSVGDVVRHLPFLHKFHKGCIDTWLRRKATCPISKSGIVT